MFTQAADYVYLLAAVLFIFGLKMLSSPETARRGNFLSMSAMAIAVVITVLRAEVLNYKLILLGIAIGAVIGVISAKKVQMTAMPQMVAIFNGLGGGASAFVALSEYYRQAPDIGTFLLTTIVISVLIGCVTLSGSIIAFGKLQGIVKEQPVVFPFQHPLNAILVGLIVVLGALSGVMPEYALQLIISVFGLALVLGVLLVIPIGGADMPVVIALLNSYSGLAVAATGFVLASNLLIIVGSLVGASGIILCTIMCRGMNRSLANVMFGAFGAEVEVIGAAGPAGSVRAGTAKTYPVEDAVTVLESARSLIVVPGYGMAAAQAQHTVRELADVLEEMGVDVKYAIHPVAGRMPGHMNVLLAEANVPYDQLYEMDQINDEFPHTDVSLVIGANDVINPAAKNNPGSPIYGMPILDVQSSRTIIVLKRSFNPGFAGIDNDLFYRDNTMMVLGDAKDTLTQFIIQLKSFQ